MSGRLHIGMPITSLIISNCVPYTSCTVEELVVCSTASVLSMHLTTVEPLYYGPPKYGHLCYTDSHQ